jgi:hypothetical protein
VKIRDKIYDAENEPVMIILTKQDKKNIANMVKGATKYCVFPGNSEWIDGGQI